MSSNTRKKTLIVIATGVAIAISGLILIGSNPLNLYYGNRITGDIKVYRDGKQVDLSGYRLACTMSGDGQEIVQSTENGTLSFSVRGREYGVHFVNQRAVYLKLLF